MLSAGLFSGRLLSELLSRPHQATTGTGLTQAVLITLIATAAVALMVHLVQWKTTWPLLFLSLYVVSTEPDPKSAWLAVAPAFVSMLLVAHGVWSRPSGNRKALVVALALLVIGAATLYGATIASDILPADGGELQVVAAELGVAHPPGFPLYTLLGHLMTRLPFAGTLAYKVNLLSAVTSTGTLIIIYLCVLGLTGRPLASLTAAIALATSTTFWAQATTANIRSLTGLFAALVFYASLRYLQAVRAWKPAGNRHGGEETAGPPSDPGRSLTLLGLALGLGTAHHGSLLFIGLIVVLATVMTDPSLVRKPRRWSRPLLAFLLGYLPLLYIPWRGAAAAAGEVVRGASADLATLNGILDHVLARGFRGDLFYFTEPTALWQRMKVMGNVITFQFEPLLLIGMSLGFLLLLLRERTAGLLLAGSFLLHSVATATYRAPQTVEYMLPAYIPLTIALGYLLGRADSLHWPRHWRLGPAVGQGLGAIMLVAALYQGVKHFPSYRELREASSARAVAESLLEESPADGVILADWHWATPLWYLQEVEGRRPDVTTHYVFPTAEPYAETWIRRIREETEAGRTIIATHNEEVFSSALPVPEPLGDAFLYSPAPRLELPGYFTDQRIELGGQIQIIGYQLTPNTVEIGRPAVLTLAWRASDALPASATLFAHLLGGDGRIYGQDDLLAHPRPEGLTLTRFHLTPRIGAMPGSYDILVGAYDEAPLADQRGEARTPVATLQVTSMTRRPVTRHPLYRLVEGPAGNRVLIGYDWDQTLPGQDRLYLHWLVSDGFVTEVQEDVTAETLELPAYLGPWGVGRKLKIAPRGGNNHYVPFGDGIVWLGPLLEEDESLRPGESILLNQSFQSDGPITRDIATSVRLIGYEEDGFHWAWWDLDDEFGIPAMGAIPTLKWIGGSVVQDPHCLTVDPAAYPGQIVGVGLGLYDVFTGRPLPILDDRFSRETPWRLAVIAP